MEMLDAMHKKSQETSNQSEIDSTVIHRGASPIQLKKKRKRRKQDINAFGQLENDKNILIENDRLIHKTDSVGSASNASCSDQLTNEMFLKDHDSFHRCEKAADPDSQSSQDIRKVALNLALQKELENKEEKIPDALEHIDYVLVYSDHSESNKDKNDPFWCDLRKKFESKIELEGLVFVKKKRGNLTFVIITCSFSKLCQEAEAVSLKMPLAGVGKLYIYI